MSENDFPQLLHTALDANDVRREAEFWRQYLGLQYRPGDEIPEGHDDADWLVLVAADGTAASRSRRPPS